MKFVFLFALILFGCGAGERSDVLCGEGAQGFVAVGFGGGTTVPGASILSELGFFYAAVSPSCRFVAYEGVGEFVGVAYEGRLSSDEASAVANFLELQAWQNLEPRYGLRVCDGLNQQFAWGVEKVEVLSICLGTDLPPPPPNFAHDLTRFSGELVEFLRPLGDAATQSVRYVVVRAFAGGNSFFFEGAPEWPLSVPIEDVAVTEVQASEQTPAPLVAFGEDAAALRAVRSRFLSGEIGRVSAGAGFVPIEQPNGVRYRIYMRDVTSFETAAGTPTVDPLAL